MKCLFLNRGICRCQEIFRRSSLDSAVADMNSVLTRKPGYVRCTFPLRGLIRVKVPLPLESTLHYLQIILQEEGTASRCLFLADILTGVCFRGPGFVELHVRMDGTWAVASGIPCHFRR